MARPRKTVKRVECPVCDGLLGDLKRGQRLHPFCEWARPEDWNALAPWFDPRLRGAQVSGA